MLILGICPFNGSSIGHATVKRPLALSYAWGHLGDFTKVSKLRGRNPEVEVLKQRMAKRVKRDKVRRVLVGNCMNRDWRC